MEAFSIHDLLYRRRTVVGTKIEVEDLFPHRRDVNKMALLAQVLLRDLEFHCLVRVFEAGKERRDGFAYLEVDGAFLDLHDHVGRELAVEGMKDVVRRASAVRLGVTPVEMVVVDEGTV